MVLLETESGVLVDVEVFVNAEYGYDIRCEVVGEVGTVALGDIAEILVRHAGQRAGHVPGHWIERFVVAYDVEMQAWIDSVPSGKAVGPSSWDGYAATAVAEACVTSLGVWSKNAGPPRAEARVLRLDGDLRGRARSRRAPVPPHSRTASHTATAATPSAKFGA